jgi:hypothetical protein
MHASAQFMKTYGLDKSVIGAFGWVKKFRGDRGDRAREYRSLFSIA